MISIYEFTTYREFLKAWIASHEAQKRGLKSELAQVMGMSSSLMSQILKGDKDLSPEQATEAAERFGLTEHETDYWFLLVEKDRAGTQKLKQRLEKKMRTAREQAKSLAKRSRKDIEFTEETKGVYYSNWIYTGIHMMSALPEVKGVGDIAKRLQLPPSVIAKVVQFLLEHGLCRQENGEITFGPAHSFIENESPHVLKHHRNWRLRGMQSMDMRREDDLYFTCPMSLSHNTAEEIRRWLPQIIQELYKKVGPSPSQRVACLNIDWFNYESDLRPVSDPASND